MQELRRLGWIMVKRRVVHNTAAVGSFDSRETVSKKIYYQVLLDLPRYLRQTSTIPSDQPILYYRLLLAGRDVEPGLGNDVYKSMMSDGGGDVALPLPAPADPPLAALAAADADDGDLVVIGGAVAVHASLAAAAGDAAGPAEAAGSGGHGALGGLPAEPLPAPAPPPPPADGPAVPPLPPPLAQPPDEDEDEVANQGCLAGPTQTRSNTRPHQRYMIWNMYFSRSPPKLSGALPHPGGAGGDSWEGLESGDISTISR